MVHFGVRRLSDGRIFALQSGGRLLSDAEGAALCGYVARNEGGLASDFEVLYLDEPIHGATEAYADPDGSVRVVASGAAPPLERVADEGRLDRLQAWAEGGQIADPNLQDLVDAVLRMGGR